MEQSLAKSEVPPQPRKASREARRLQLIEATIETIAVRGYARTTLTEVANQAGLSHGLVNFHFETKEKLLTETLNYLAEEYSQNWKSALEAAGKAPAEQLDAMIRADFNPAICTTARLSAWCAFWGEAQCRPMYQEHCGANDDAYFAQLVTLCTAIQVEGSYGCDPKLAARVLRVTLEGVWLEMMTMNTPYSLAEALSTAYACAAAFFPRHFGPDGLVG
ncbi:TetR family transcriptional regulator C-terminal domain-containing protein [Frigidibacter sp. SD6-1]|uniref:TetR family transcriptional regulator C-terminal domain-containing protein n=1 Tax=Frigidibacter sp. SD6-1 TaxID=3032581 RepID=UPI0024DF6F11|nr:TetR family transcriptional regulator C-terminal domain-containing protein [Frigidibacter sp. SD6-1]